MVDVFFKIFGRLVSTHFEFLILFPLFLKKTRLVPIPFRETELHIVRKVRGEETKKEGTKPKEFSRGEPRLLANNVKIKSNTRHDFYVQNSCGKNYGRQRREYN